MENSFSEKTIIRFWERVNIGGPDDCWEWVAYKSVYGYGWLTVSGHQITAHRVAYLIARGNIPDGLCVCHSCDNRACCNPSHLWLGTYLDNNMDKDKKGRRNDRRGAGVPSSKIDAGAVFRIRSARRSGLLLREIAKQEGISIAQVSKIARCESWKHIEEV